MVTIDPVVSEEKSFEIVDGRRRTTEPAYTINSPGAFGSGGLKSDTAFRNNGNMLVDVFLCHIIGQKKEQGTVELQWLEHLWDYENLFETGVVRAIEGLSWFNWWVSYAPEFQCCYYCESSCLCYLSFNFYFYVSKIMHL